jgi:D-aminoacyl-tRNA deacylase
VVACPSKAPYSTPLIALIQRVSHARVSVEGQIVGAIGPGALVFLGVAKSDSPPDVQNLVNKILKLRMFTDDLGKMNYNLLQISGEILIVSQFTLCADTSKGSRPSFSGAAPPPMAKELYNQFIEGIRASGLKVATGEFQAHMKVELENDGPVTFLCQS